MQSYRGAKGGVNQAAEKLLLKRNVCRCFLKVGSKLQYKTSLGRLFQMKDAEYECERLANSVFILGIVSSVYSCSCLLVNQSIIQNEFV